MPTFGIRRPSSNFGVASYGGDSPSSNGRTRIESDCRATSRFGTSPFSRLIEPPISLSPRRISSPSNHTALSLPRTFPLASIACTRIRRSSNTPRLARFGICRSNSNRVDLPPFMRSRSPFASSVDSPTPRSSFARVKCVSRSLPRVAIENGNSAISNSPSDAMTACTLLPRPLMSKSNCLVDNGKPNSTSIFNSPRSRDNLMSLKLSVFAPNPSAPERL